GRPRGGHPLGGARGLQRPRRQAGGLAAGLPARDRPHPSDPGAPGPYRPPSPRRFRLRPAFQDQGRPARPGGARRLGRPRPAGPPRLPPGFGAPRKRRNSSLGSGLAGGFAPTGENPPSGTMTQGRPKNRKYYKKL